VKNLELLTAAIPQMMFKTPEIKIMIPANNPSVVSRTLATAEGVRPSTLAMRIDLQTSDADEQLAQ
jgi:hypothetical protein